MAVAAVLPGFQALSEFWSFSDTCGETAFLVTEHALYGQPALSGPEVDAFRADMARHGFKVEGGTTMSDLVAYCQTVRGRTVVLANVYGSSADAIHQTLLAHAGRDGVVLQIAQAYKLPGNEPGVQSHFVAIGGIDPVKGYLVANGDDVLALNVNGGHGKVIPCRWMTWDEIVAAAPVAVAVFANPNGGRMPLPTGWKDDGTQLTNPTNTYVVRRGFRLFVLNAPVWEADDVPLQNEEPRAVVVATSPEAGAGVRQVFTKSVMGYTKQADCFRVFAGAELLHAEQQIATLQRQLATATQAAPLTDAQKTAVAEAETAGDALKKAFG
jgi:hypothetical protein